MKLIVAIFLLSLYTISAKEIREFKNKKLFINNKDELELVVQSDSVSFFVIGDWGGLPVFPYRSFIETATSKQMTKLGLQYNTQFQLGLGDNFYFDGVTNLDDKRFEQTFEQVFQTEHLLDTPWFFLLGNHDHYGNATAQIDYMKKSKRWILPSMNYSIDVKINNGNDDLLSIMMIDTVTLCGNSGYDWEVHREPRFESLQESLQSHDYLKSIGERLKTIGESNTPYVLVAGHFPVWSIGEHGPTKCLLDKLRPLLHQHKVSAYLCGHDHDLQHISDTYLDQKVDYIVSGAANFIDARIDHINDIPENTLRYRWNGGSSKLNGGFALVRASIENMTISFFESNGLELYQTVIYPRK